MGTFPQNRRGGHLFHTVPGNLDSHPVRGSKDTQAIGNFCGYATSLGYYCTSTSHHPAPIVVLDY